MHDDYGVSSCFISKKNFHSGVHHGAGNTAVKLKLNRWVKKPIVVASLSDNSTIGVVTVNRRPVVYISCRAFSFYSAADAVPCGAGCNMKPPYQ